MEIFLTYTDNIFNYFLTIYAPINIDTHVHTSNSFVFMKVWFDGISNIEGYLMPNPLYTYILEIYDL